MEAYGIYQDCVGRQAVQVETQRHKTIRIFPTGLLHLPYDGSLMDQPNILMEYFDCFLSAERSEFFKS